MLRWRWSAQGNFTTSTAYKMMQNSGVKCPFSRIIWKLKVPHKVRVFIWIAIQNKLLTQEALRARGCMVEAGCHLCHDTGIESARHILYTCAYSVGFWNMLLFRHGFRPTLQAYGKVFDMWWSQRKTMSQQQGRLWDAVFAAGCWALW